MDFPQFIIKSSASAEQLFQAFRCVYPVCFFLNLAETKFDFLEFLFKFPLQNSISSMVQS